MGSTTRKGELGEAMILADLQRKGYAVAIPFGHDLPFDLILIRRDTFRVDHTRPELQPPGRDVAAEAADVGDPVAMLCDPAPE